MEIPESLIRSLQKIKGFDEEAFKAVHESGKQVTSIRFNPNKLLYTSEASPTGGGLEGAVPWSTNGYYLSERPSFTLDPLFHAGAYYVQEASSMFLEEALKQTLDLSKPLRILDLCAAPGGKSTLIQSLIPDDGLLVSNEVIKTRVNVLAENMTKWGGANVVVTNNDPKDFQRLGNYFDAIVVDAPCSGSGLFRKDPQAIDEWSENNVALCSQRQQRILADILPSLKEGGILIYSTCSYSEEEDEAVADWLLGNYPLSSFRFNLNADWKIAETCSPQHSAYGFRFFPDKLKGEGFFIAGFVKKGMDNGQGGVHNRQWAMGNKQSTKKKNAGGLTAAEVLKPYLKNADDFFFIRQNDELIAMPLHLEDDLAAIRAALYIKKAGVKMGTIIRNELIPDHELAMSTALAAGLKRIDTDKATALQYLRREEIRLTTDLSGWALLSYLDLPLGWMKVLPNRINNYYPSNWRILNK